MTAIAERLVAMPSSGLARTVVLLPTKRLIAWLTVRLAQSGTRLLPVMHTLEEWTARQVPLAPGWSRQDLEWRALGMLAKYEGLETGDEHELIQLLVDCARNEVPCSALDEVLDETQAWQLAEEDELVARLGAIRAILVELDNVPHTDRLRAEQSRRLATKLHATRPDSFERLLIVGMTSFLPRDRQLLASLLGDERTEIWLPRLPRSTGDDPLAQLRDLAETRCRITPRTEQHGASPHREVLACPTPLGEVTATWERVSALLAAGVPAHEIAIAVTSETEYAPLLREALKHQEANLAVTVPMLQTRLGSWLKHLIEIIRRPEEDRKAFLLHPVTRHLQGYSYQRLARDLARRREHPFDLTFDFPEEAPVRTFGKHFQAIVTSFQAGIEGLGGALDRDARTMFEQWMGGLEDLPDAPVSRDAYCTRLLAQLQEMGVRTTGHPFAGIQVLSVEELRFMPFQHVFILGCTEGRFPRGMPADRLLDPVMKRRMGLPGWDRVEAIENTTFRLLAARLPHLTLLYPATFGGRDVVRSRFIENLEARFERVEPDPVHCWRSQEASSQEPIGRAGQVLRSANAGLLKTPFSTRAIEDLLACPMRFALRKLGVVESDLLRDTDPTDEGEWLHAILESFFTCTHEGEAVAPAIEWPATEDAFHQYCVERLLQISEKVLPEPMIGSSLDLQLRERSWPAFARHLWQLWDGNPPSPRDPRFGKEIDPAPAGELAVAIGKETLTMRLRIDSIDPFAEGLVITDYKRRYTSPRADVSAGLAPQLPLYAAAIAAGERGQLDRILVGYFSILKGEWHGMLAGAEVLAAAKEQGLLKGRGDLSLESALDQLGRLLRLRREEITEHQTFAPDPSSCGLCTYQNICRRDERDDLVERLNAWRATDA